MESTIKFDLNDPESRLDHLRCVKALDMALVLWEVQSNLKREFEHQDMSDESWDKVEQVFERISELLEIHDVRIDKLVQ